MSILSDLKTDLQTKLNTIIAGINARRKISDSYSKSEIDTSLLSKLNVSDIIDSLVDTSTNKTLSAKQGKVLKDLIDSINLSSEAYPVSTFISLDTAFIALGLATLSNKYQLANGGIINTGVFSGIRTPNLMNATLSIISSITNGNGIISVSLNDVTALNVGDTVSGIGISAGAIISAINYTTGQVTLSKITNSWNGTTYNQDNTCVNQTNSNASLSIVGQTNDISSDSINWDLMFSHWHDLKESSLLSGGHYTTLATYGQPNPSWGFGYVGRNNSSVLSDNVNGNPRLYSKTKQRTRKVNWYFKIL